MTQTTPSTSAQGPVAGWKLVPVEPTNEMLDAMSAWAKFPVNAYAAMLTASPSPAASPASPSGVRVKALEWDIAGMARGYPAKAECLFGTYTAWEIDDGYWKAPEAHCGRKAGPGLQSALDAAQADYEARILSALDSADEQKTGPREEAGASEITVQSQLASDTTPDNRSIAQDAEPTSDATPAPTSGAEDGGEAWTDVLAERRRQVQAEGWTPEHDDTHTDGEMADAAALYASMRVRHITGFATWPWDEKWWKPKDRRSDLVRAGALILAEIERLDRKDGRS